MNMLVFNVLSLKFYSSEKQIFRFVKVGLINIDYIYCPTCMYKVEDMSVN